MLVIAAAVALAMSTMSVALAGAANKATGSGTWTNDFNVTQTVEFNAHEAKGNRPAKGELLQEHVGEDSGFRVEVTTVVVNDDGTACFSGPATEAWGRYGPGGSESGPGRLGQAGRIRTTIVSDGGAAGEGGLRGTFGEGATCEQLFARGFAEFTGGNVTIHSGK